MKKYVLSLAIVSALLFVTTNIQAQSWADLFKKENIEKVVNAVTGNNAIDMTGTWTYSGSAIEFESDNLLQKAGGAAAASLNILDARQKAGGWACRFSCREQIERATCQSRH